jgi:hypothetical protein
LEGREVDVDGDVHVGGDRLPDADLATGFADDPLPNGNDETSFLGHGDELTGVEETTLGVNPTDQGFGFADFAGGEIDQGLEVETEFVLAEGAAEIGFEGEADAVTVGELSLEEGDTTTATAFGVVHGGIGGAENIGGLFAGAGEAGDTDTGTGNDRAAVDDDRFLERGLDAASGEVGSAGVADTAEQAGEFVAAETGDQVAGANSGAKAVGDGDEELVAGGVAKTVVDGFETVEVEEEEGGALTVVGCALEITAKEIEESGAIGETGEWIVEGAVGELALLRDAGGGIAEGDEVTAGDGVAAALGDDGVKGALLTGTLPAAEGDMGGASREAMVGGNRLVDPLGRFGRQDGGEWATSEGFGRGIEEFSGGGVGNDDVARGIEDDQTVGGVLDKGAGDLGRERLAGTRS